MMTEQSPGLAVENVRQQIAALRKDLAALRPAIDEVLHWRDAVHIVLRPHDLAALRAGETVGCVFETGEQRRLEVQVSFRDVTGSCRFGFMRRRSYTLEWPTARQRECIKTIEKYLKAGATFYRRDAITEGGELTDPRQIVMLDTIASCYWSTSKKSKEDRPGPDNPW